MSPPPAPTAPIAAIEAYLDLRSRAMPLPPALTDAIRYALLGGGKRIRPLLAWHACAACGAPGDKSLPAGAAVEMVHAFSLVHDDLPAMDDDDLRRGRPTLHIHAGEAMAILAGDALLAMAFQVLVEQTSDAALGAALVRELGAATASMIAGQVEDTLGGAASGAPPHERLLAIHRAKTAALIRAACRMGAMCAGAGAAQLDALSAYGDAVGLMFQVVDDLLDVEQSPEHAGKRTRKDAGAGKLTYPTVLGIEGSRREVARLESAARRSAGVLGPGGAPLAELCAALASRTR